MTHGQRLAYNAGAEDAREWLGDDGANVGNPFLTDTLARAWTMGFEAELDRQAKADSRIVLY